MTIKEDIYEYLKQNGFELLSIPGYKIQIYRNSDENLIVTIEDKKE